jgi:Permuted papain-like amidase enzyme, YaeF/YiiX, C92 family
MTRFVTCLVLLAASACSARSVAVQRPADPDVDAAVTAMWVHEVQTTARTGDWLLSRAYYLTSDLIALGTPGESLSHGSIYDAEHGTVIEAVGTGVREISIEQFMQRNHFVIVVRPSSMTAADGVEAVARARTRLGAKFDATGMFGIDNPERFYCTELVYWASQTEARSGRHEIVVTPSDLMKYGEVIYWSGKRDDAQVMQLAASRRHVAAW